MNTAARKEKHSNMRSLLNTINNSTPNGRRSSTATINQDPTQTFTAASLLNQSSVTSTMTMTVDPLEFEDAPVRELSNSRPMDYLDLYLHDLDFNLRLLMHEIALIQVVFHASLDTQHELVSQLKTLFVDIIHREFDKFFEQKLDLSRLAPLDQNDLIVQVVQLLSRINQIKDNLGASQFDDMESSMRLLRFVMRTNEICAPVFANLLDAVRHERNSSSTAATIPTEFSLNPFMIKVCSALKVICSNKKAVAAAIRIGLVTTDSASMFEKERSRSNTSINRINSVSDKTNSAEAVHDTIGKLIGKKIKIEFR